MRILMTTDTVGGVWTFTQELAAGLLQEGCKVALVSLGRAPSREQSDWACSMERQWRSFHFRSSLAPLEWMQDNNHALSESAPLLLDLARDFRPDVLHSNQFCFGALPVSMPTVVTAHSDVLTWREGCGEAPIEDSLWMKQYRTLVSEGLQGADEVVAPTQWMQDSLARHFILPRKGRVIPNGRDLRTPGGSGPRRLQAVTAGRMWDGAKGISLLCDIPSPMPLLIAGDTKYETAYAPDTSGNARLLGPLTQAALLQIFKQSAVYICTSRYEPFGLAPLEAALCGCAVVANDLPSLREVWGGGAIYFRDKASLSELLYSLHGNTRLLKQAQVRSYARARTFSRGAMAASYLSLYRSFQQSAEEMADVA